MESTRSLATIAEISELIPITGADRIELAKFVDRDWEVIVEKTTYQVGMRGVYFEPDSFLPVKPEFEELRKSCFRTTSEGATGFYIRTMRMRGVYSQGYFQCFCCLPQGEVLEKFELHANVTELLEILQWPADMDVGPSSGTGKPFPHYIPKTEEKRVENLSRLYSEYVADLVPFTVTEKLDGTSCTVFLNTEGEFGVCSRNFNVTGLDDVYNQIAKQYDLDNKLRQYGKAIAIQGEIIGPKIQNNRYARKTCEFRVFNAWDMNMHRLDFLTVAAELGLETVPILYRDFLLPGKVGQLRTLADGPSQLNAKTLREGFVLKSLSDSPETQPISFKVISREFLSKKK